MRFELLQRVAPLAALALLSGSALAQRDQPLVRSDAARPQDADPEDLRAELRRMREAVRRLEQRLDRTATHEGRGERAQGSPSEDAAPRMDGPRRDERGGRTGRADGLQGRLLEHLRGRADRNGDGRLDHAERSAARRRLNGLRERFEQRSGGAMAPGGRFQRRPDGPQRMRGQGVGPQRFGNQRFGNQPTEARRLGAVHTDPRSFGRRQNTLRTPRHLEQRGLERGKWAGPQGQGARRGGR
jgi:hypothetical protein